MRQELEELLCTRYPLIFQNRSSAISTGSMGRGFSCGDGWFDLIDTLCDRLQSWTVHNNAPQVVASQVKEKWGQLGFYIRGANDEQRGMVLMAQALSGRICEVCGKPGRLLVHQAHMTRCQEHAPEGALTIEEWKVEWERKKGGARAPGVGGVRPPP